MAPRRPAQSLYKGAKWVTLGNLAALAFTVVFLSVVLIASHNGPQSRVGSFPGAENTRPAGRYQYLRTSADEAALRQSGPRSATRRLEDAEEKFHVIFSTDCSAFQDWQSYLVFLSAEAVGHKGPITRIASGCTEEQEEVLQGAYSKLDGGRGQFRVHVTPDFSIDAATGKKYVFYNKPGGLQHWLQSEHAPPEDSVVALIDPDFVFMKPLSAKIRSEQVLYTGPVKESDLMEEVGEGRPVAQFYGIGDKWIEFNLTHIAGADSPSLRVKSGEAWEHYSIGPPYIVHRADLFKIAQHWHDFVPRVFEGHPHLLAEMYAYSVASAHLQLPHLRLDNYMTSETEAYGEAWPFVEELPTDQICTQDLSETTNRLPGFLHYCQHYHVPGELVFWKRDVDKDIFSCDSQPLPLPEPQAVADLLAPLDSIAQPPPPPQSTEAKLIKELKVKKNHAFQYCQVVFKVNKALDRFKQTFC